ncbi:hypothetical protein ACF0H5_023430 [Mactra antiquata]
MEFAIKIYVFKVSLMAYLDLTMFINTMSASLKAIIKVLNMAKDLRPIIQLIRTSIFHATSFMQVYQSSCCYQSSTSVITVGKKYTPNKPQAVVTWYTRLPGFLSHVTKIQTWACIL